MTKKARAALSRRKFEAGLRAEGKTVAEWMAEFKAGVKAGIAAAKRCPHNFLFGI